MPSVDTPARRRFAPAPFVLLAGIAACLAAPAAFALDASMGVYRIPYADGTALKVGADHLDHSPPGRIDMNGTGGGTYRVVAAADGIVRHVVDGFDQRLDCKGKPAADKKNNYVWIEHANGEWTKYTHMRKDSSSKKAKLKVGQFVRAGTYLGDEGEVGCASGPHLHFEVGVPRATDGIAKIGGFLNDNADSRRNRIPRICGIEDGRFVSGRSYKARSVPGLVQAGSKEYARHGVPARDYQCLLDQATIAGYAPVWVDGFSVDGDVRYNVVFRPAGGGAWRALHGLDAKGYQQRFDQYAGQGFRPIHVESYRDGKTVRYAAIFRKDRGPETRAYHGLSAQQHQQRFDELVAAGFRPRNIAVTENGGQPRYTALYEKTDIGGWIAKSRLTPEEYQTFASAQHAQGREPVYLNAYGLKGQVYFTAIFATRPAGPVIARHGLDATGYQQQWDQATHAGYATRAVVGYGVGGKARYAAVWRK